ARTALFSQERSARGDDEAENGASREAFDNWFYSQRKYPGTSLPAGAIDTANRHADDSNFDERDDVASPRWHALGPETIPGGQTDASAGQISPVSGRVSAIATDPSDPDVAYVGGAQGGVWKTKNALSPKP